MGGGKLNLIPITPSMQRHIHSHGRRAAALLVALVLTSSCSDPNAPTAPADVRAVIDGTHWTANARADQPFAMLDGEQLEIRAYRTERLENGDVAESRIVIRIPRYRGIATYELGGASGNVATYTYSIGSTSTSWSTTADATGTFAIGTVEAHDRWIAGTFSFDVRHANGETRAIRDGEYIGSLVRF